MSYDIRRNSRRRAPRTGAGMKLIITLTEDEATGKTAWCVEGGTMTIFDGADEADSIKQAMLDAAAWIEKVDGG